MEPPQAVWRLVLMSDAAAKFTSDLLSYAPGIHDVVAAADAVPDDATLNAYASAATLFAMTPASYPLAAVYLHRALVAAKTAEDALLAQAIQAWHAGNLNQAITLFRQRIAMRPDDLASSKICQLLHLDLGDFDGMVATVRSTLPHHRENHFVLGQLAFALEEAGHSEEARPIAIQAAAMAERSGADDPWSLHACMHVQHRTGSLSQSIAMVRQFEPLWDRCGSFMRLHAWWHAAIAALDLEQPAVAMALYDDRLADADPDCVQSLVARVSLLARLRLRGTDVGDRWAPLRHALQERVGDGINGFLDVHYAYGLALAGQGEKANRAADRLDDLSARTAKALIAHAEGRSDEATAALAILKPQLQRLGGSHEQRQLYELVELDAALTAGHRAQAAAILRTGRPTRPPWQQALATELDACTTNRGTHETQLQAD